MRANEDSDWTNPDTAAESAITERPAPAFWRCEGEGAEPVPFGSLLAATLEPPRTPAAMIAGRGVILAESAEDVAQWSMTDDGMRRLDAEMAQTTDRDSDVVLSVLLARDFQLAVGS